MKDLILREMKQYRSAFILAPILMILSGVLETEIPMMMTHIIDDGISANNLQAVWKWGAFILVLSVGTLIFAILGYLQSAKASTGLAANLRQAVFGKVQTFSFANLDKFGVSSLVTRTMTDVTNIQNMAQTILTNFFKTPVSVIYALYLTAKLNKKLSLVLLIGVVIIAVFLTLIIKKTIPMYQKVYQDYDKLNGKVQENVTGIRIVKSFAKEKTECEEFDVPASAVRKGFIKVERIQAFNNPVMMLALEFCFIGISWVGAKYISVGEMSTGDLAGFINYAFQIMTYISTLVLSFVQVSSSLASIKRVKEVLAEKPTLVEDENPVTEMTDEAIRFSHVSFRYGQGQGKNVLEDIDLSIRSGEMIGIIGATGSSKTSFINLISRLYDATEGTVTIGGVDVRKYATTTLSDHIAVVLQKNVLFSGTVLENLRWGKPDATLEECEEACRMACADGFIREKEKQYEEYIEQGGANLSGGQRQRLCLARALIRKPKILILDDALSALDTETESTIRATLRNEMPDMTKLIITQRVGSIQDADRILILDKGRIDGFDTHEALLKTNAIYRDLCGVAGKESA